MCMLRRLKLTTSDRVHTGLPQSVSELVARLRKEQPNDNGLILSVCLLEFLL